MRVILLRGLPGSGKSTFGKKNFPEAYFVSSDFFFEDSEGGYHFDPGKIGEAHAYCMRDFISALTDKRPLVVVDNTNITKIELAPYILVANAFGAEVEIITISYSNLIELNRNIHGVPYRTLMDMEARWENNFPPFWPRQRFVKDWWKEGE